MSRYLWPALVAALAAGLFFFVLRLTGCEKKPTDVEQRVDSTLAEAPAWRDSARAKDSVIAVRERERNRERVARLAERARADSAEAIARSLQIVADTLALIPEGTASDSVAHLLPALAAQKRAAAAFELLADSLLAHRSADSARLVMADSTLALMKSWRVEDQQRIDKLTTDLSDLREEGKNKGNWRLPVIGLSLPGWTKCVVLVAVTTGAGALTDGRTGAVLGGGAATAGCLVG